MAATRFDYTSCSRRRGLASQAGERRTARGEAFHLGDGADLASSAARQADCAEHPNFQAGRNQQVTGPYLCTDLCARPGGSGWNEEDGKVATDARQPSAKVSEATKDRGRRPRRPSYGYNPATCNQLQLCGRRSYAVSLTATVTAMSTATNGLRQPSTANHSRTI